eukprot:9477473-Alexandrium_andersonii.AAC.1
MSVKFMDATAKMVCRHEEKAEARFSEMEAKIDHSKNAIAALKARKKAQLSLIQDIQKAMAAAEKAIPIKEAMGEEIFDRDIDAAVLKIGAP